MNEMGVDRFVPSLMAHSLIMGKFCQSVFIYMLDNKHIKLEVREKLRGMLILTGL